MGPSVNTWLFAGTETVVSGGVVSATALFDRVTLATTFALTLLERSRDSTWTW